MLNVKLLPNMGSAKVMSAKPHLPEYTDKKSIKNLLKKPFQVFFKDKKKEKANKNDKETVTGKEKEKSKYQPPPKVTPVTALLENFQKLEIEKKAKEANVDDDDDDELKNFTFTTIKDDRRSDRIDPHSSQDNGFSVKTVEVESEQEKEKDETKKDETKKDETKKDETEKDETKKDETKKDETNVVIDKLKDLTLEQNSEGKKKKRLQKVYVKRTPIKNKKRNFKSNTDPYSVAQNTDSNYGRQIHNINQVNKQTLSGGQVIIVNSSQNIPDNYSEISRALTHVDKIVENFAQNSQQEQVDRWQLAQEYIEESSHKTSELPEDILSDFIEVQNVQENFTSIGAGYVPTDIPKPNPIEEFTNTTHMNFDSFNAALPFSPLSAYVSEEYVSHDKSFIYPTPPRSVPSPMLGSPFYPSNTEYTLSPEGSSSMYNSDYEKYQDISSLDQYPSCVADIHRDADEFEKPKPRERNPSTSSMTMKQFKDMQKELSLNYSRKECCQINRKSCKEIFEEHMQKLTVEQRRNLCLKVAHFDLKYAYGILQHTLLSLSKTTTKQEDYEYALFSLVCERVLAQNPTLFLGSFGLNLIKLAVLRCYRRPLLTRHLVQCVHTALKINTAVTVKDHIFHEVDALGDNLLIACARAGDMCADVLAELVRRDDSEPCLFNVHHVNSEGYSALHVACNEHTPKSRRLHIVHVLLEHGNADLEKGDVKGGDTALHLAVNSVNCELQLVLLLFQRVDRKQWKQLAHAHNRSSVTPLEYARSATKSTTRQYYPHEVLDFLKKCR